MEVEADEDAEDYEDDARQAAFVQQKDGGIHFQNDVRGQQKRRGYQHGL